MGIALSPDAIARLWRLEPKAPAPPQPKPQHVLDEDERIAENWRTACEKQRKHPGYGGGRRVMSSVPPWLRPKPRLDWD